MRFDIVSRVDNPRAIKSLSEILIIVDRWGNLYDVRWGKHSPYIEDPALDSEVTRLIDSVRGRIKFANSVALAMGETELAIRIGEYEEGQFGGHPFSRARIALVEAIAILTHAEELALITGPTGPRLAASELHETIWTPAATLWDDGHYRYAVQAASSALEEKLQVFAGAGVSGEGLGALFSPTDPLPGFPRLRFEFIDSQSKTGKSAHEGASALVRGAFMGVRNLVSHPGWPEPTQGEALEMLAVFSFVARMSDRAKLHVAK